MARVTIEDCLLKVPNRFALVHMAAKRVRQFYKGAPTLVKGDNKEIVMALRDGGPRRGPAQREREEGPPTSADQPGTDREGDTRAHGAVPRRTGRQSVFRWEGGTARFEEGWLIQEILESDILLTFEVILKGISAMGDFDPIREALRGLDQRIKVKVPASVPVERLALSPAHGYILSRVDGTSRVQDVLALLPPGEDDLACRFLYGLLVMGSYARTSRGGRGVPGFHDPARPRGRRCPRAGAGTVGPGGRGGHPRKATARGPRRPGGRLAGDGRSPLGSAEFIEQLLVDERKKYRDAVQVFGATEGKRVYINPLHHKRRDEVVSTLIHEGVHRARPGWKESSVLKAEKRLSKKLNQEQADAVFTVYKRAVRRLKGVREI